MQQSRESHRTPRMYSVVLSIAPCLQSHQLPVLAYFPNSLKEAIGTICMQFSTALAHWLATGWGL